MNVKSLTWHYLCSIWTWMGHLKEKEKRESTSMESRWRPWRLSEIRREEFLKSPSSAVAWVLRGHHHSALGLKISIKPSEGQVPQMPTCSRGSSCFRHISPVLLEGAESMARAWEPEGQNAGSCPGPAAPGIWTQCLLHASLSPSKIWGWLSSPIVIFRGNMRCRKTLDVQEETFPRYS